MPPPTKHNRCISEPPEIPADLTACDPSRITDSATIDQHTISGTPPTPIFARSVVFEQSSFSAGTLTESTLPASRWTDCQIDTADLSNATWIDARLVRTAITESKLTGFDARGASLRDVRFKDCKAPDMLLSDTKLRRVRFDDCQITNLNLTGATIQSLSINYCDARMLNLQDAKIDHLDLRNSRIEGIAISPSQLKHITILPSQATALAQALGVNIIDQ